MSYCIHGCGNNSCIPCAIEKQTGEIIKTIKAKPTAANQKARRQMAVLKDIHSFERVESLIKHFTAIGFSVSAKQQGNKWTVAAIRTVFAKIVMIKHANK